LNNVGIAGVGPTDADNAAGSDITFTAVISSAEFCQKINQGLHHSTAMPVMLDAAYTDLS